MSELGVPGSPFSTVISMWWIIEGILIILYETGFFMKLRGTGRVWITGQVLVMIFGLTSGIGSGIFPCEVSCAGVSFSGKMHEAANVIGTFSIVLAPFFTLARNEEFKMNARVSLAFGAAALPAMVFFVVSEDRDLVLHQYKGLIQRVMFLLFYGWIVVQGLFQLQRNREALPHRASRRA